jgi:hypothetical protein
MQSNQAFSNDIFVGKVYHGGYGHSSRNYELHRKKQKGLILKLDFEKAYDKVNWSFLQQVLRMKGFLGQVVSMD